MPDFLLTSRTRSSTRARSHCSDTTSVGVAILTAFPVRRAKHRHWTLLALQCRPEAPLYSRGHGLYRGHYCHLTGVPPRRLLQCKDLKPSQTTGCYTPPARPDSSRVRGWFDVHRPLCSHEKLCVEPEC